MCGAWLNETRNLFKPWQENPGVTEKACLKHTHNNKTKSPRSKDNLDLQKAGAEKPEVEGGPAGMWKTQVNSRSS